MNLPRFPLTVACAALSFGLLACSDVDSTNLKTAGIRATLWAVSDGTGTASVNAEFQVDDTALTYVGLKEGDQITATVGDQTKTLQESEFLGIIAYGAAFPGKDAEGTTFSWALERAADTSATHNSATIPAPFTLTSPADATATYSRANDDIVVTYDNSGKGDPMSYHLRGTCISASDGTVPSDSGTFTIHKGSIPEFGQPAGTCQVELRVSRTRDGALDAAFAGGHAYGMQERTLTFTSTP